MQKILTFNNISTNGLKQFEQGRYQVGEAIEQPDAVICRSAKLHDFTFPTSVKCVGRAGAGVNNIPVDKLTELGIPVLNTPGANANAVKELVVTGLLLASRNICQAWQYVNNLEGPDDTIAQMVEQGKKQYVGYELPGRTLAVIGLGSIGVKVANAAIGLGMRVIGYDPKMTVKKAWELSSQVEEATSIEAMLPQADFISVHVPLNEYTKGLINAKMFAKMKPGVTLLNFARDAVVDEADLLTALAGNCHSYVCDFPTKALIGHPKVIALPHLGASTIEAEENCAVMVVNQVKKFLEYGNIKNSVNFPDVFMPPSEEGVRIAIANRNIPNMVAQISTVLAEQQLNIIDLLNKSRDNIAFTVIDVNATPSEQTLNKLLAIEGVINARICNKQS